MTFDNKLGHNENRCRANEPRANLSATCYNQGLAARRPQ